MVQCFLSICHHKLYVTNKKTIIKYVTKKNIYSKNTKTLEKNLTTANIFTKKCATTTLNLRFLKTTYVRVIPCKLSIKFKTTFLICLNRLNYLFSFVIYRKEKGNKDCIHMFS